MEVTPTFTISKRTLVFLLFAFFTCATIFGQSNFRSRYTDNSDRDWTTASHWEVETSPGVWATASAYPGQSSNNANTVTIRNKSGGEYRINANIPFAIGNLVVGVSGTNSATLAFRGSNGNSLTVSGNVTVADGRIDVSDQSGNRTYAMTIGGNLTVNSGTTFDMTDGDDEADVTFNGTDHTISGGGSYTFRNLTFSNTGTVVVNNDIGSVVGFMTVNANSVINPSSTSDIFGNNGSDLTGTGKINVTGSNSLTDQYDFDNFDVDSMTVDYSGTSQSINSVNSVGSYGTLMTSGSGTKTLFNTTDVLGSLTIGGGTTLSAGSNTIEVGANWLNNGAFTQGSSTVEFDGPSSQSVGGTTATTFNNLRINKSSNIATLLIDATVNGTLTLSSGSLDVSNRFLRLGSSAVSGTFSSSKMIIASNGGELRRSFTGTGSYLFPIGDATSGNDYSPVTVAMTAGSFSGAYVAVSVVDAKHLSNASASNYLTRYWNVTSSGITGAVASVTGTYTAGDVNGTAANCKAAQLKGVFNQASNPWLKFAPLSGTTLSAVGATLTTGETSAFTGITNANPSVSITGGSTHCEGELITLTATPTGDPSFTYFWSNGLGTSATAIAPSVTPGTVTYTVTVTDGNGITASNTVNVTINANVTYYADLDSDGFGDPSNALVSCVGAPVGYITDNSDSDDALLTYVDLDGDGYGVNVFAPSGPTNTLDCDDSAATTNPGAEDVCYDGIDNDCNGIIDNACVPIVSVVETAQCGQTLAAIDSYVYADIVPGAQGYRFRVKTMTTNEVQTIDRFLRVFKITQLPNYAFDTQYQVEVAVRINNVWQPFYGAPCTVFTPATTTELVNCGATLTAMTDVIYATSVPFSTGYQFKVTNALNALDTRTVNRNLREFRMGTLAGIQYNTTYTVEVAVRNTDGVTYLPYGTTCTVTTPSFPATFLQDSQCDDYLVPSNDTVLYAESFPGVEGYRFRLTNGGLAYTQEVDRVLRTITLNDFTGLTPGANYSAHVALKINGVWGSYTGKACSIVTPGGARAIATEPNGTSGLTAVAYPNPFTSVFSIDVPTENQEPVTVKVYDMLGRVLEQLAVPMKTGTLQLGEKYPAGVYNVVVTQGESATTLRVIKR